MLDEVFFVCYVILTSQDEDGKLFITFNTKIHQADLRKEMANYRDTCRQ